MRLLLIRHGQTPANVDGVIATAHPGPGLTALGELQSASLPVRVAEYPIESIYVSTLVRTHLTAAPLAAALGLQPIELPGVHEIEAGVTEGRTDEEAVRAYLGTMFSWASGDLSAATEGAPDGNAFLRRFSEDVERVASSGVQTAAIFSHGAAIRVWVALVARNIEPSFVAEHPLDNTGVVVLDGDPESGWTMSRWPEYPVAGIDHEGAHDPTGETLGEATKQ